MQIKDIRELYILITAIRLWNFWTKNNLDQNDFRTAEDLRQFIITNQLSMPILSDAELDNMLTDYNNGEFDYNCPGRDWTYGCMSCCCDCWNKSFDGFFKKNPGFFDCDFWEVEL